MQSPRALIISLSDLNTDPRVLREINWLSSAGWQIETFGIGKGPIPNVSQHHSLLETPHWRTKGIFSPMLLQRLVSGLVTLFAPQRIRYHLMMGSHLPASARNAFRTQSFDLIVINDIEFLPLLARPLNRRGCGANTKVILDLHEYHPERLPEQTPYRFFAERYWRWLRRLIAHPVFDLRTVVSPGIAERYHNEFRLKTPTIILNTPDFAKLAPSATLEDEVHLVYHGIAAWDRHPEILIDMFQYLDTRFVLHLMLTGPESVQIGIRNLAEPLGNRVIFEDPVPVNEIAATINKFDLALLFFPPDGNPNILFTLPNKLFESIQGRLGIVLGRSPNMIEVCLDYSNSIVVDGWTAEDLAAALNNTPTSRIVQLKINSSAAAAELNSEKTRLYFLQLVQSVTEAVFDPESMSKR